MMVYVLTADISNKDGLSSEIYLYGVYNSAEKAIEAQKNIKGCKHAQINMIELNEECEQFIGGYI